MPVSTTSSRAIYDALKDGGIRLISALPETWLVHLIRMAEEDPEMILVRLAKEEEGVGISAGANVWASLEVARRPESAGKTIVTFLCDTGERYLTTPLFAE